MAPPAAGAAVTHGELATGAGTVTEPGAAYGDVKDRALGGVGELAKGALETGKESAVARETGTTGEGVICAILARSTVCCVCAEARIDSGVIGVLGVEMALELALELEANPNAEGAGEPATGGGKTRGGATDTRDTKCSSFCSTSAGFSTSAGNVFRAARGKAGSDNGRGGASTAAAGVTLDNSVLLPTVASALGSPSSPGSNIKLLTCSGEMVVPLRVKASASRLTGEEAVGTDTIRVSPNSTAEERALCDCGTQDNDSSELALAVRIEHNGRS